MIRKLFNRFKRVDRTLLTAFILLLIIGTIAVASASWPEGLKQYNNGYHYTTRHIRILIASLFMLLFVVNLSRDFLKKFAPIVFVGTLIGIALLWSGYRSSEFGQERWLVFRVLGRNIRLQPSDFLKVSSILFFAKFLEEYKNKIGDRDVFLKILIIIGVCVIPVMTKDLSTALVIGVTLFAMFWVGGMKPYQFFTMAALGAAALYFFIFAGGENEAGENYRLRRITDYIKGRSSLENMQWQTKQGLYAIAMGGLLGVGLFRSRQKYTYLPLAHNDMIFAVFCEEFGILGGILLILIYCLFLFRGYRVAIEARNLFDKYVAIGITTSITIQAIFNLGVATNLFPVTGITLPFISYGGTSLLTSILAVGILLGISIRNKG